MKLEAAIANFIDGIPSRSVRQDLSKDRRLFFTFGVHPKRAHKVTPEEMKAVKEVVLRESKCVGISEMDYDLTDGCSVHLDKQMKVFKEQLRHYASKELWSTVMVIHCRDSVDSKKATELCLDTMGSQLFSKHRGSYRIHVHCFNGGMKEKDAWLAQYPTAMFGFTGLLLSSERHPELEEVVRSLEPTKILRESDSPHLLPPAFKTEKFNTPYGIDEVARRIAFLRGKTVREILDLSSFNAKRLYGKIQIL